MKKIEMVGQLKLLFQKMNFLKLIVIHLVFGLDLVFLTPKKLHWISLEIDGHHSLVLQKPRITMM